MHEKTSMLISAQQNSGRLQDQFSNEVIQNFAWLKQKFNFDFQMYSSEKCWQIQQWNSYEQWETPYTGKTVSEF